MCFSLMLPSLKVKVLRLLRVLIGKLLDAGAVPTTSEGINKINLNDPSIQVADSELGIGGVTCQKKRISLTLVH